MWLFDWLFGRNKSRKIEVEPVSGEWAERKGKFTGAWAGDGQKEPLYEVDRRIVRADFGDYEADEKSE
jgi:hypothetical protein